MDAVQLWQPRSRGGVAEALLAALDGAAARLLMRAGVTEAANLWHSTGQGYFSSAQQFRQLQISRNTGVEAGLNAAVDAALAVMRKTGLTCAARRPPQPAEACLGVQQRLFEEPSPEQCAHRERARIALSGDGGKAARQLLEDARPGDFKDLDDAALRRAFADLAGESTPRAATEFATAVKSRLQRDSGVQVTVHTYKAKLEPAERVWSARRTAGLAGVFRREGAAATAWLEAAMRDWCIGEDGWLAAPGGGGTPPEPFSSGERARLSCGWRARRPTWRRPAASSSGCCTWSRTGRV